MAKKLYIKKKCTQSMNTFHNELNNTLEDIGLNAVPMGRDDLEIFEASGEGGFVLDYTPKVISCYLYGRTESQTEEFTMNITPIGAKYSLVPKVFNELKKFSEDHGHDAVEED